MEIISTTEFNCNKLKAVANELVDCIRMQDKPKGFAQATSYTDYDAIKGSKEEFHADVYQRLSDELFKLRTVIEKYENMLDGYKVVKEEIEETYSKLSGLECKVFYLRKMRGKTIKEIASELGYTYNYITDIITKIRDISVNTEKNNVI
jgi:predicted transcriptional regulator